MDPIPHLAKLGLSDYEARAYTSLVKSPSITADQTSEHADVPKGRIYDVLNTLEERNIVHSDRGRPRTYNAVEPKVAIDHLVENKRAKLEEDLSEYEQRASEAQRVLDSIEPREREKEFWTTAVKELDARKLLLERLSLSEEDIAIYKGSTAVHPPTWKRATETIIELLEKDVTIRLLIDENDEGIGKLVKDNLPVDHSSITVKQAHLPSKSHFYVIDGSEASLEIPHPSQTSTMLAVLNFRNGDIVTDLSESFESLWDKGTTLE